ncbi:hypothetical protein DVK44_14455 [Streptomyces paludis]|uniref:Uncharacterized protein n=1 Tax=Streptomyces paludis TaxID=2282738 RepID=A0A345HPT9_9ACTN|nr:hypothetical protein DVK44_14455 [Streptomyces paludis]
MHGNLRNPPGPRPPLPRQPAPCPGPAPAARQARAPPYPRPPAAIPPPPPRAPPRPPAGRRARTGPPATVHLPFTRTRRRLHLFCLISALHGAWQTATPATTSHAAVQRETPGGSWKEHPK